MFGRARNGERRDRVCREERVSLRHGSPIARCGADATCFVHQSHSALLSCTRQVHLQTKLEHLERPSAHAEIASGRRHQVHRPIQFLCLHLARAAALHGRSTGKPRSPSSGLSCPSPASTVVSRPVCSFADDQLKRACASWHQVMWRDAVV